MKLSFKGRTTIGKFFVVEHETAIIGINDAEKLGLIRVNFDLVEEEQIKIINEVNGRILNIKLKKATQSCSKA